MRLRLPLLLLLAVVIAAGCSRSRRQPSEPVVVERFDLAVADYAMADSATRDSFRRHYAPVVDALRGLMAFDSVTTLSTDTMLLAYATSRGMDVFGSAARDSFPSLSEFEFDLAIGRDCILQWDSLFRWPEVYAVISTYNQAVLTTDSAALVALNHFFGYDYPGYSRFERYQLRYKRPGMLAPLTLQAILASHYPYRPSPDATSLSRLVYEGALTVAVADALDGGDAVVADLLGWTPEQWLWAADNESQAWKALVDRGLLYSVDPSVANRLVNPAPSTPLLHPDAPGRMGVYFGSRIARRWLSRHADASPLSLLDSAFYNLPSVLIDARYAPM